MSNCLTYLGIVIAIVIFEAVKRYSNAGVCYLCPGTTHQHLHQNNTASAMIRNTLYHGIALQALVSCALINLVWNFVHMKAHQRCPYRFLKIHHGLMRISSPVIITTADAHTRRQHKHKHKLQPLAQPATCMTYQRSSTADI